MIKNIDGSPNSKKKIDKKKRYLVEVISSQNLWKLIRSSTRRRLQVTPRRKKLSVSIAARRVTMCETTKAIRKNIPSNKYI
jgi:hypothetical protein